MTQQMTMLLPEPRLDDAAPAEPDATDARLEPVRWDPAPPRPGRLLRARALATVASLGLVAYFAWLLRPSRVGHPVLFTVLAVVELFNAAQAIGFWWTCLGRRPRRRGTALVRTDKVTVDVFIPTYNEPVEIVEPVVAAAARLTGARVRVMVLDDGNRDEMAALARRHGVGYLRRSVHSGAKAGNINHALGRSDGSFVLVLDCDHVPAPGFLERTLPEFVDPTVAYVQTPQYYANGTAPPGRQPGQLPAAAWQQQALFFGPIATGKDAHRAMFCCGTNVVFRRAALDDAGGFPENSVTEDFELSIGMHERGWTSAYVPEVLASGLGPEDAASYVSQQNRWARGCVGAIGRVLRSRLRWRLKLQYLLSASYFLTGWTVLVYLSLPAIRIVTGAQPVAGAAADSFLAAFAPYFVLSLAVVAMVGGGRYTFRAYSLAAATFWIHVHASCAALRGRRGSFVVTPKQGASGRQVRPVWPTLAVIGLLACAAAYGVSTGTDAATLNNVAFATVHIAILAHGIAPALVPALNDVAAPAAVVERRAA